MTDTTTRQRAQGMGAVMVPHRYRLAHKLQELEDTATLYLEAVDRPIEPPRPGQFSMLYVFGVGEVPISYSGDLGDGTSDVLVHTIRAVGQVSRALVELEVGQMVGVRGPFGRGWPVQEAYGKDLVLMAGGLGAAPLRPVVYHALRYRERFGRVVWLCGSRTPDTMLYLQEQIGWQLQPEIDVSLTVDTATRAKGVAGSRWMGEVGLVTRLIPRASFDPSNAVAMVCGPEIMMRFSARDLVSAGIDGESVYVSMERNMQCAVGLCGHCQWGKGFVCKDGPVFSFVESDRYFGIREL